MLKMNRPETLVSLRGVGKSYATGVTALEGIDLDVGAGEFLTLLGPSGCGKSTILRLIAGLDTVSSGALIRRFDDVGAAVGFVFQEPTLMPWANVLDNVFLPLRLRGQRRKSATRAVGDVLALVGLAGFEKAYPRELSGGMRMRVSIARALVLRPLLLLMDEPFAALDEITRFQLNDDLLRLKEETGATVVFVTHSIYESAYLSTRIAVMGPRARPYCRRNHERRGAPRLSRRCLPRQSGLPGRLPPGGRGLASGDERMTGVTALPDWLRRSAPPALVLSAAVALWEACVRVYAIPPYVLPAPSLVLTTLTTDRAILFPALVVTLGTTLEALALAVVGGVALAVLFAQSKWVARALLPVAIILQVTPIIAVAPLLLIYLDASTAVLVCAFLVAFFPILSNTALGLASVDRNLADLFTLYRASGWRTLLLLRMPAALPYFLGGLRIGGGLALVGAIAAELAAGAAGKGAGLAFRIVEAGYRLNIPRMFAALVLISLAGIAIFASLSALSACLLGRWHESALGAVDSCAASARLRQPTFNLEDSAMPSRRYDVLGLGNAIVDVISRADDDFLIAQGLRKGGMTLIDEARAEQLYAAMGPATIISGGSAANTIIGLAQVSAAEAAFIGKVKADELGGLFAHDIRAAKVGFSTAARARWNGQRTLPDRRDARRPAHHEHVSWRGCQDLTEADIDEELVRSRAVTYLEGYLWDPPAAKAAFVKASKIARAAGREVALSLVRFLLRRPLPRRISGADPLGRRANRLRQRERIAFALRDRRFRRRRSRS